eukprot:TRINITY_DN103_c0_g2_i1.p1 TRINITY_DN103_c0_g2~~TRINITY_DN103_c0_g2_i1.p1  ORF type:complete len:390 (-),score=53.27 TRINITY_DN103_c0_g2_i1:70-1239(-)
MSALLPSQCWNGGPNVESILYKADIAYEFKNWKSAYTLYKQMLKDKQTTQQNIGHVYYRLGVMFKNGHFITINEQKAKKYFKLAFDKLSPLAEEGDCEALCDLGSMYEYGEGVDKNHATAVQYYSKAADKGFPGAQCNLGYMYNNGRGVKLDREKAVYYYKKASDLSHVRAQYNLGYLYKYGYGVIKDYAEAVRYYKLSAEQGYTKAQHNLGYMYSNGFGVEQDKKRAAHYYKLAADQKNAMSSYNLALMYQKGEGVPQDHSLAFKYFLEATEMGHKEAKSQLEKIRQNFTTPAPTTNSSSNNTQNNDMHMDYLMASQTYVANEWPQSHLMLSEECQKGIYEMCCMLRLTRDVPRELVEIMVKDLIKRWPNMGEVVFDHCVNARLKKST